MPQNAPRPSSLRIEALAHHPEAVPTLVAWFEAEWPGWYCTGRGDAAADLQGFARLEGLPLGLIALDKHGRLLGIAALKAQSIVSHGHLSPWAAVGCVDPARRGQAIGLQLLRGLEARAAAQGLEHLYCATGSADSLLRRASWQAIERIAHEGQALTIYRKPLRPADTMPGS
ncbi:GNAT family N-acetyltransferase [Paucibacter sp. PLA-PC-4]|uniref:GNAT family N-acetyltransferase n=1 Tax=Paucibacter sp. PLA-PC-4 TaxID=2993655 RepID=UPI0022488040|nr:GNAT family N-acetyltransferase [Paucibacter sp. PLA-PC-4]MCX2862372.1 GNAT family N-acetyltransferase [Paucibacter sp. PLA-PC-4]